jgi:hypothetical protein
MRHQHDIIIYDNSYPGIYIGGGISAFLVESVVATIEIKSILATLQVQQIQLTLQSLYVDTA